MNTHFRPRPSIAHAVALAALLGAAAPAVAQYKIVGPDGSVTFTDKPPPASRRRADTGAAAGADAGSGTFPFETRQAMSRYPVTLYAQKACGPCDQARSWLKARGIPFGEYSIETIADADALKQRFGTTDMPILTMGSQTIKGFLPSDYAGYADAAGYPKQARLAGYTWPAAVPLAPTTAARSAPTETPSTSSPPSITLPQPSKNGIQF